MRTKHAVTYHGRKGHPIVHSTERGRRFIMVRAKGGGTKRVYSGARIRTTRTGAKGKPEFAKLKLR